MLKHLNEMIRFVKEDMVKGEQIAKVEEKVEEAEKKAEEAKEAQSFADKKVFFSLQMKSSMVNTKKMVMNPPIMKTLV